MDGFEKMFENFSFENKLCNEVKRTMEEKAGSFGCRRKNNVFKLDYKIWLTTTGKAFGKGPCEILKSVERFGSLKGAAEEMGMSYSHAWNLIKRLERHLGFKLLHFQVGGESGGGAILTPEAKELMRKFDNFMKDAEELLNNLFIKHFY